MSYKKSSAFPVTVNRTNSSKLTILHVAYLSDAKHSGVAAVIPNYLKYQARHANVALLNLASFTPASTEDLYDTYFYNHDVLESMKPPFDKPDLIVFHEVYRPAFIKISHYFEKKEIPYIITPHGGLTSTAQSHKRIKKILGNHLMFKRFINGSNAVHYLSESEREKSRISRRRPSFVCANGLELKGRKKISFQKQALNLVYVGRLDIKIKGIDKLLEAACIIQDYMRKNNISITVRGYDENGSAKWIRSKIRDYGVNDIVDLGGPLFGDEKINLILKNDCFIQLSRTEGQPMGIIEAMDLGMPCIVTAGTTFHDSMKLYGSGIPAPDTPAGIAQIIVDVKEKRYDLNTISLNASSYAEEQHDWKILAKKILNQYKSHINLAKRDR